MHKQFILRQLTSTKKQSIIFILCVALSMVTLVGLRGFSESVNAALLQDAQALQAADVILSANFPFSAELEAEVQQLVDQGDVEQTRTYRFLSVVRVLDEDASLLANLKVVEPAYPFYGEVILQSGDDFQTVLEPGKIVVAQLVLDRLGVAVGDSLRIGNVTMIIQDVLIREPEQPVNFFNFGPRIFVASDDLDRLGLITEKSRVSYRQLLKVKEASQLEAIAERLDAVAIPDQERVETYRSAESGVKRFFDDFLFFLSLIAIFTLLLSGIGIQSSLMAYLRERDQTIAIVKTLGASSRFITTHFLVVVAILGIIGTIIGLTAGFLLQGFFPILFSSFLPPNVTLSVSRQAVIEGLLLGIIVVGCFTFLPLYRLQEYKPSFIFRKEAAPLQKGVPYYATLGAISLFFVAMVFWQLRDTRTGIYFIGGVLALILITAVVTELMLRALRRTRLKHLESRQALRGLFRPRNATRSIVITLAASLAVIFTIFLIERNLDANFIQSYPEDAPNVFFLDIQPDQVDDFDETLNMDVVYYPVVRGTISTINGQGIDREVERERDGDNLARTFNLSYREDLIGSETLVLGETLFQPDWDEPQVSILTDLLEIRDFQMGDTVTFKIQGVPIQARISSIRQRDTESIEPFFYFIFPPTILQDAPHTIFTAVRVEKARIAPLQNEMVAQ
ncbi:MAG: FtsX-like permease family protein, partial [Chloroflexota bacterium]